MLCYIRNNIFKRLLHWKNLCADCVRELKKRDPIAPEAKSLSAIAKRLEPKKNYDFLR